MQRQHRPSSPSSLPPKPPDKFATPIQQQNQHDNQPQLRVWAAKGKGTALVSELSLPGALDRGLVYSGCSKVAVVPCGEGGAGSFRLLVSLTEPSHSRLWVSQPFRSG
jgi:hypothetical protein